MCLEGFVHANDSEYKLNLNIDHYESWNQTKHDQGRELLDNIHWNSIFSWMCARAANCSCKTIFKLSALSKLQRASHNIIGESRCDLPSVCLIVEHDFEGLRVVRVSVCWQQLAIKIYFDDRFFVSSAH